MRCVLVVPIGLGACTSYVNDVDACRPLPERRISLYGRQIIEGMLFLTKVGFGVSGCHAGNVMMRSVDWCVISEFENASLGLNPLGTKS